MAKLMQQMGITTEEIDANRIVIEKKDGLRLVIENPSITQIDLKGQKMFQVTGEPREEQAGKKGKEETEEKTEGEEDVEIIMRKTGASREQAQRALDEAGGNIAQAILSFHNE